MAASIWTAKDRNLVERIILVLFRNHFVKSTLIEGERFDQGEQGSGIGFVARGQISDSVFSAVMEKAYILKQDVIGERCIKSYFRCRDDIFMIAEGGNGNLGTPPRHWKFVANQNKSSYLSWVVSSDSIVFLDTELYLGLRWKAKSKIDSRTHMKTRHPWVFHCLSKVLIKIGYTCGGHGVKSEGLREDPHSTLNSSKPRISSSRALKSMSAIENSG